MGKPDCPFCAGGKCKKLCKEVPLSLSPNKIKMTKTVNFNVEDLPKLDRKKLKKYKKYLKKSIYLTIDRNQKKLLKKNLREVKKSLKKQKKMAI